jgi:hypothetical protein
MAWIKTVPPDQTDAGLRRVYDAVRALYPGEYSDPVSSLHSPDGSSDSIVAAHTFIPEAMRHLMSGLAVLLQPHLLLTRRQHKMITSVVSVRNRCFY